jgi:hypothetical protein
MLADLLARDRPALTGPGRVPPKVAAGGTPVIPQTSQTPSPLSCPVRGVPGGWRDWWDDPDDSGALQARGDAIERRQTQRAADLGVAWQRKIREEHQQAARERAHRPRQ